MYLPYVRGKQYELIALRELVQTLAAAKIVSPIIEPVKRSTSTLTKTLKSLAASNVNFTVILNPLIGELKGKVDDVYNVIQTLNGYSNFQIGIIVRSEDQLIRASDYLKQNNLINRGLTLIHTAPLSDTYMLDQFLKEFKVLYNVIDYDSIKGRRYHRNFKEQTLVSLEDRFREKPKNADYQDVPEEDFSDEYKYYEDDGYVGFSDFATIGGSYSEGGFLPWAVAIHLTFEGGNGVSIRHFVSDSNDDNADVPGKFAEALQHLIEWLAKNNHYNSSAIKEFKELHHQQHYPGLGSIKKLSLKHHVELMIHLMNK